MWIFDLLKWGTVSEALKDAMELIDGRRVTESGEPETWWPDEFEEERIEAEGEEWQRLLREAAKEMRDGDE